MRRFFLKQIWAPVAVLLALSLGLISCEKEPKGEGTEPQEVLQITAREHSIDKVKNASTFLYIISSGPWTLTLEYPEDTAPWATVTPESGEKSMPGQPWNAVVSASAANSAEDARVVHVVLHSGDKTASVDVYQSGTSGSGGEGLSKPGAWLELPETPEGKGFLFGAHDMNGDVYISQSRSGIRNWSCWWSPTDHLSMWVAYPLNAGLKGSGRRTEAWGVYDPCFDVAQQPNCYYTYGGGWTRGHQIPSADRLRYNGSQKCNESTFYPTNMTPQEYDFNSNIWANLEGAVRTYSSKCDTLYVVTGCDLKAGAYGWSGTNTGFSVKAPGAYWKAVLAYKKSSQSGFSGTATGGYFCGCAFYLPHDKSIAYGNHLDSKYMMSIDDLETKLGIDLYVNLPDRIGTDKAAGVESTYPGSFWK